MAPLRRTGATRAREVIGMGVRYPRLASDAQILPTASGWLVRYGPGTVEEVEVPSPADPEQILQLLDGSRSTAAIAAICGITSEELERLLGDLRRLSVLANGARPPGPTIADRARYLAPTTTAHAPMQPTPVLLVGLGGLGIALLRRLLAAGSVEPYLFDPAPVRPADIGPFYRMGEIGRSRLDVVLDCLDPRDRSRVRAVTGYGAAATEPVAPLAPVLELVRAVICCVDQPSLLPEQVADACRRIPVPMVLAELSPTALRIGPSLPREDANPSRGCAVCAAHHRADRDRFTAALRSHLASRGSTPAGCRSPLPPQVGDTLASYVVAAAWRAIETATEGRRPDDDLLSIAIPDGAPERMRVPKHHACTSCFPAVVAGHRRGALDIQRDWVGAYRREPVEPTSLTDLRRRLQPMLGDRYGLLQPPYLTALTERRAVNGFVRQRGTDPRHSLIAAAHWARCERTVARRATMASVVTVGLDFDEPRAAEVLAMMEGLERLFALDYCEPERIVRARYAAVASDALDPRDLPLFAEQQYREPGFPYRRFDPDASMAWVWGFRLSDDRPLLVPRDAVYDAPSPSALMRPTSNGAACHSSLHHAILNALYETIERDALMVVWLNRLSLPRLAPPPDLDPGGVRRALEALSLDCGYVDITTDLEIPVVLGILRDRLDPDFFLPNMVASLDPATAFAKLHREFVQFAFPYFIDRQWLRSSAPLDSDAVTTFPDHLAFYQNREHQRHAAFLDASDDHRRLDDMAAGRRGASVQEQLDRVVGRLTARGYQPIVVDCTPRLLRELGLHAVKVLVPGLQPLNAGHRYRPLGGRRVTQVAMQMELAERERTLEELNPWPHPFW